MSSWVQYIAPVLNASGTLRQGRDARMNARLLEDQARAARSAAARDEETQRREARIALGRQAAAVAEAGGGSGGSAGALLEQSAVFAELDALNIRYGGELRAKGLLAESMSMRQRARSAGLLAGGQLLTGFSRARTRNRIAEG